MTNVFASDVHKQKYMEGVQDELRDSIPMQSVSEIQTDNVEYIHNRYGNDESAENSTDSTYEVSSAEYADDAKLIDQEAVKSHRITYKEMARQGFDIAVDLADRHGFAMAEAIHRHSAITTYGLAEGVLDNEVLGGTASALTPITLSDSNPDNVAATITQILQEKNAYSGGTPFTMMSPKAAKNFNLFSMGAGFEVSDNSLRDGLFRINKGHLLGLDTIVTNEVPRSLDITFSGNPSDAETVTITPLGAGTVTFTMKTTPAAAGAVDIGANAEGTIDNLVAAINVAAGRTNDTTGAGSTYIAQSAASKKILKNAGVKAVKVSATVLRIITMRYCTIAEGLTNATAGTYVENIIAGMRGAPVIALPSAGMHADEEKPDGFLGKEVTTSQIHDAHVFYKNRAKLVRVLVAA